MDATEFTCSVLRDFDWKTSLVMGSSKLASMKTSLLTIHLYIKEDGEPLLLEMDKQESKLLLKSLEDAQAGLLTLCKPEYQEP